MNPTEIKVRTATYADLPAMIALENRMWSPGQRCSPENFERRWANCNDGYLVVETGDGQIVGCSYAIVIHHDPARQINWHRDSGDGTGSAHDRSGNACFSISTTVADDAPKGTFRALVDGWRDLTRRWSLHYMYGASRIPGFASYDGTVEAYVAEVLQGTRFDPVLSKWKAVDMKFGSIIPGYFVDPLSESYGITTYDIV